VTSSVSGKRSPTELTARVPRRDATRAGRSPRIALPRWPADRQGDDLLPRCRLQAEGLRGGRGIRDEVIAELDEYAPIYGSPVPGYVAPADTVEPASRVTALLLRIIVDAATGGRLPPAQDAGGPAAEPGPSSRTGARRYHRLL
jgi:Tetracyclin repressor-like, C-terminal domain